MGGLESTQHASREREHHQLEPQRRVDRDVIREHVSQPEDERHGQHDASSGEQRRMQERVARMARRPGAEASAPTHQGGSRYQQLKPVEPE